MSATKDKVKGAANEIIGKGKKEVGKATGNEKLKGRGTLQEAKGKAQKTKGNIKSAVKKAIDKT